MNDDFLDENGHYQYLILKWLEIKQREFVHSGELTEFLGISRFKLKQYIDQLASDIRKFNTKASIEVAESGQIFSKGLDTMLVKQLRLYYLKESMMFLYLNEVLLNGKTVLEFCDSFFISKTKAYEIKKNLNLLLKEEKIKIGKNNLKGEELKVRNFLVAFFFSYFNGLDFPFSTELYGEVTTMLSDLIYTLKLSLSNTKKVKLEIFLAIYLIRKKNHVDFSKKTTIAFQNELWEEERKNLSKYFTGIPIERSQIEWNYLLLFLYCEQEIQFTHQEGLLNDIIQSFDSVNETQNIYQNIVKGIANNEDLSLSLEIEEKMSAEIQRILIKNTFFSVSYDSFYSFKQIDYFKENYPLVSRTVVKEVKRLEKMGIVTEHQKLRVYYDLLFAIIDIIPLNQLEKPIHVCVDFSHGDHYSGIITAQILGFKNLTLKIEKRITTKTHLFISDIPIDGFQVEQIIWKNPPTPEDWEFFGNKVIEIKRRENFE